MCEVCETLERLNLSDSEAARRVFLCTCREREPKVAELTPRPKRKAKAA